MNYALFVRDPENVWANADDAFADLRDLVRDYSQGKVMIGLSSESGRIEELEGMLGDHVDEWDEAKAIVKDIVSAVENDWPRGDLAAAVTALKALFDDGS